MFLSSDWELLTAFTALFCTCTSFAILVIRFSCRHRRRRHVAKPDLSEIDILNALKDAKVFPVEQLNGWKLHDYVNGQQMWSHDIQLPHAIAFACFSKVKGSPQMVLNILKDIQKYEHWTLDPHLLVKQDSVAESLKSSGRQYAPSVYRDVIGIEVASDTRGRLSHLLNRRWFSSRFQPAMVKVTLIQRYWHREENGCCWLLEFDSDSLDWTFCLMQPIEGWFETDRCMLTFVSSFGTEQRRNEFKKMAVKLCSIRDYLQYRRIQSVPLVRLSLNYCDNETTSQDANGLVVRTGPDDSKPKETKVSRKDSLQEISLLQKFRNMIELKKESYEADKRRRASLASSAAAAAAAAAPGARSETAASSHVSIQNPLDILRKLAPSKSTDQPRGRPESEQNKASSEKQLLERREENGGKNDTASDTKKANLLKGTVRKRTPTLNEIGRSRTVEGLKESCDHETDLQRSQGLAEDIQESVDISTSKNKDSELENRLKLMADATATTLLKEKSKVSQLNITSSYKDQVKSTGGWIYRGLEKDTVILQKAEEENFPLQSYLGKGMVPFPPKLVFETLRNPQNRKSYDDMIQKVETLHEFQSGMKIVYMYYEVFEASKKKCHDFCLLQSEKTEGKKYIITFESVEWPKCKQLEKVTRLKISSSGWIIEPVFKGNDVFSMVTYVFQMDLRSTQESSTSYVEEFPAKQPRHIIALRQYLTTLKESNGLASSPCEDQPVEFSPALKPS